MIKIKLIIILFGISCLFFPAGLMEADARLATEACFQQDYKKGWTLWVKISYDEVTKKHECYKTWQHFSDITESDCDAGKYINNCKVPEVCGSEAGRVFTDPDCKPKLKPETTPPSKPAETIPPSKPAETIPPSKPAETTPPSKPAETTPPSKPTEPKVEQKKISSSLQESRDSMFTGIAAGIVIAILIGIGILAARQKLYGSIFGGGGSRDYDDDDYDDGDDDDGDDDDDYDDDR